MSAGIIVPGMHPKGFAAITPTPEKAARAYFASRVHRALRGTASGESMATWGPQYIREARAVLDMSAARGTLWERVGA